MFSYHLFNVEEISFSKDLEISPRDRGLGKSWLVLYIDIV